MFQILVAFWLSARAEAERHNQAAVTALDIADEKQTEAERLEKENLPGEAQSAKDDALSQRHKAGEEYSQAQDCIRKAHQHDFSYDRRL